MTPMMAWIDLNDRGQLNDHSYAVPRNNYRIDALKRRWIGRLLKALSILALIALALGATKWHLL